MFPQVFSMNLLFEINIELSDKTYASTCEFLEVDTIEQSTIDKSCSSWHLEIDLFEYGKTDGFTS